MILANGCPKSGTHALMALFQTIGMRRTPGIVEAWHSHRSLQFRGTRAERAAGTLDDIKALSNRNFCHAHVCAKHDMAGFKVVTIFRDPRNVLISYVRYHVGMITLHDALSDFLGKPFIDVYRSYLGWRGRALCVRYEDFPKNFAGDGAKLYENARRDHNTWTGNPSNWRDYWTDDFDYEWRNAGGYELVKEAGYEKD